ncbi:hypothetical protein [Caballeronia hypogeia]|uniref:hypothetical protein n=1 Tax=Caballeronia hypogeia TaxID=1777140 RepID=UPI0012FD4A1C|nr:hypothetical protein [Caballeronia hypogeia]
MNVFLFSGWFNQGYPFEGALRQDTREQIFKVDSSIEQRPPSCLPAIPAIYPGV